MHVLTSGDQEHVLWRPRDMAARSRARLPERTGLEKPPRWARWGSPASEVA